MPFQIKFEEFENPTVLDGDVYTIGRGPNCDIRLKSKEISTNHASLIRVGDNWKIKDEGSSNGTFVNGRKVSEQALNPGDKIQLNGSKIAIFTRVFAEEETLFDGPTNPGDLRPELQALTARVERSYEENKSFHEVLADQMQKLREEINPLVCRVDRIEENMMQFSGILTMLQELRDFRKDAKKLAMGALGGAAAVSIIVFGSVISQDHDTQKDFASGVIGEVIEEVGGPSAIGSLAVALLTGSGLLRLKSSKSKSDA